MDILGDISVGSYLSLDVCCLANQEKHLPMNEKRDITGPRTGKQTGKNRNKEGSYGVAGWVLRQSIMLIYLVL